LILPLAAVGQEWHQKEALETDKFISQDGSVVWGIAVGWFNNHHHIRNTWGAGDKTKIAIGA
jgi:hypothetical protein